MRLTPTGTVDPTFGTSGKAIIDAGYSQASVGSITLQPDGNILVGSVGSGSTEPEAFLVRVTREGVVDPGFAAGGKAIVPGFLDHGDGLKSVELRQDGRILVAGGAAGSTLWQFQSNGLPDSTFNGTGRITTPVSGGPNYFIDSAVRLDGGIVAGGAVIDPATGKTSFDVVEYPPDGTPDSAFGAKGIATLNSSTNEVPPLDGLAGRWQHRIGRANLVAGRRWFRTGAIRWHFQGDRGPYGHHNGAGLFPAIAQRRYAYCYVYRGDFNIEFRPRGRVSGGWGYAQQRGQGNLQFAAAPELPLFVYAFNRRGDAAGGDAQPSGDRDYHWIVVARWIFRTMR
jgi:uncharacterized delta-60 repeat protein